MPKRVEVDEKERYPKRRRTDSQSNTDNPRNNDAVSFEEVWKALRRAGWTSRRAPGRSLDLRYRYVRPAGNPIGKEGEDYFVGEQALIDYYSKNSRLEMDDDALVEIENSEDVEHEEHKTDDSVTHSSDIVVSGIPGQSRAHCVIEPRPLVGIRICKGAVDHHAIGSSPELQLTPHSAERVSVSAKSATSLKSTEHTASAVCAVCKLECSRARTCTNCGSFLHHFCSHDVCAKLKIRGPDGQLLIDFGDASYCCKLCYETATSPVVSTRGSMDSITPTRLADLDASSLPLGTLQPDSVPAQSSQKAVKRPRIGSKSKAKAAKSRISTTTRQATPTSKPNARSEKHKASTSQNTTAGVKKRAEAKTTKPKANADALRKELSRRLQESAANFVNASSPAQEQWMDPLHYANVGAAFLVGVVTRYSIVTDTNAEGENVPTARFEIRWINTAFQTKDHVHHVDDSVISRGVRQFVAMQKHSVEFGESWSSLCNMVPKFTDIPSLMGEFEEIDDAEYREWSAFRSHKKLNIDLCPAEVEAIEGMTFSPTASLDQVPGLFTRADGSTTTKLRDSSKSHFGGSATASFFCFSPAFVVETSCGFFQLSCCKQ